jgi:hypothetical protein
MMIMTRKETDRQTGCSGWAQVIKPYPFSCTPQTTSELTYSRFNIVMSVGMKATSTEPWISSPLQAVRPSVRLRSNVRCKFCKNCVWQDWQGRSVGRTEEAAIKRIICVIAQSNSNTVAGSRGKPQRTQCDITETQTNANMTTRYLGR